MPWSGVADLHNEHALNDTEDVHGVTFQDDDSRPSATFQGHQHADESGFRDAHDDPEEWSDHQESAGHDDQSWRLNATVADGGSKSENFWADDQHSTLSDIQDNKVDNSSDVTQTDQDDSAFSADFAVDRPGNAQDEDGSLVGSQQSKHQLQSHTAPGVYDLHEESSEQSVAAGSFDTIGGIVDAMNDWGKHIDMPPPPPPPPEQQHSRKREAQSRISDGGVALFSGELEQVVRPRGLVARQEHESLGIVALILVLVALPFAVIGVTILVRRDRRARRAARAERLGEEEVTEVLAHAKSGRAV